MTILVRIALALALIVMAWFAFAEYVRGVL